MFVCLVHVQDHLLTLFHRWCNLVGEMRIGLTRKEMKREERSMEEDGKRERKESLGRLRLFSDSSSCILITHSHFFFPLFSHSFTFSSSLIRLSFLSILPHSLTPLFLYPVFIFTMSTPTANKSHNSLPSVGFKGSDLPPLVTNDPPRVLIAGAGLGGLFLGIYLERAGIPYEIYERSSEIRPLGT